MDVDLTGKIGSWLFIIGVVIAVIAGFKPLTTLTTSILIALGFIVGFINITAKETMPYLFTVLVLVFVADIGGNVLEKVDMIGPILNSILNAIIVFTIPATLIVSLKAIFAFASTK